MKICPLFSGSSGNSTYVEIDEENGILIDCGRSTKQIESSLANNEIDMKRIKAVLITHEHTDHVAGLKVFLKKHNVAVYSSEGTMNCLKVKGIIGEKSPSFILDSGKELDLTFASIIPFETSHDCVQGMGFVVNCPNGSSFALCTDLGYVSENVKNSLLGCKAVMIEANHDVMMLQNGPYPYYLKRRILSDIGHLSNEACAEMLPLLVEKGAENIILSHLSSHNNIPELAIQTALAGFSSYGMKEKIDFNIFAAPKSNENKFSCMV